MRKLVIWLVVFLSVVSAAQAQDASRQLQSGQPVSGNIDTHHLTQIYSFTSKLPFANGLRLENSGALPLKIVIIDAAGIPLITVDNIAPGTEGRLKSWLPPTDGTYYVVVYPTESLNDREGAFTLTLDDVPFIIAAITEAPAQPTEIPTIEPTAQSTEIATAQPTEIPTIEATTQPTAQPTAQPTEIPTAQPTAIPTIEATTQPTEIPTAQSTEIPTIAPTAQPTAIPTIEPTARPILPNGLYFELDWRVGARLSLEIRDPQGQAVHWNSPASADGGSFVGDTDPIDCTAFSPHLLTQTVMWSAAVSGSYEILVHYIDGCTPSAPFTLSVSLNGLQFPDLSGIAQENETFVGGIVVNADGTGGLNSQSGMVSVNPTLAIQTGQLVSSAETLPLADVIHGQIDNGTAYHAYQFEGKLGEVVAAEVRHTSGNLDTMIALLDTHGNLLALNDDSGDDTTDSAINKVRLRHGGMYLLVVTRYGQLVGATEGEFDLTVTGVK